MLPDYKQTLHAPLKFRHVHVVVLQATFSSGVADLDETNSSPSVSITKDTTGDYNVVVPKGQYVHVLGCHLDPASDNPTDATVAAPAPRSWSATAGTGKVLFQDPAGALQDPVDGARLYLTVLVGRP